MSGTTTPPDYTTELDQIAASLQAIETSIAAVTTRRGPPPTAANERYLSGRQPRRSGDTYAPKAPINPAGG